MTKYLYYVKIDTYKTKKGQTMSNESIIVELLNRVIALEKNVSNLKSLLCGENTQTRHQGNNLKDNLLNNTKRQRNYDQYEFNGEKYGKGRLVLAVVKQYMLDYPNTSADKLMKQFPPESQGPFGVVRELSEVKEKNYQGAKRYFDAPGEIIKTTTDECVVSTQWGIENIINFIEDAERLGYTIKKLY